MSKKQIPVNPSGVAGQPAENSRPESGGAKTLIYAGTGLLALVIVYFILQLGRADLNIPFAYEWRDLRRGGEALDPVGSNDALLFYSFFKGMRENGWYQVNPALGAPGELNFSDYPFADNLHFLMIKAIEWVTPNYAMTVNLFFLLGFPLAALSALFVFRQFKLNPLLAVTGSLLFTFLPYHFLRGQQHLWLATYYPVPLVVLMVVWVMNGEPLFLSGTGKKGFPVRMTRKGLATVMICVLVGSTGVYYALFSVFYIVMAALLRHRTWKALVTPAIVVGLVFVTLLANAMPSFLYTLAHGKNNMVAQHFGAESEFFGLRIMQMLLPVMHHRIAGFAEFAAKYYNSAPFITENATACLGLVGSVGFLILLAWLLGLRWQTSREPTLTALSALNICTVLLATVGGFSSLLAYGVSPAIRCYNRFSIFIAFFAILTVLFVFEKLRERWAGSSEGRVGWLAAVVLLLGLGLADQTTEFYVPPYAQNAASFQSDKNFVERIEARVPPGAMIFQLPYMPFPEGPMGEMSLLRGYLHSKSLRWSFGAMAGREADTWIKNTVMADGNIQRIVQVLTDAGFKGIYLDRQLLRDYDKIESAFKQLVDASPIESEDGRLVFYRLSKPTAPAGR